MHHVELPLGPGLRLAGPLLILLSDLLVLACPIAWPARLWLAATLTLLGTTQWLGFLRRRPVAIEAIPPRGIACRLADGSRWQVRDLQVGALVPWLISARLQGFAGERAMLFLPGGGLRAQTHRQLRRMLVAFSDAEPPTAGRGTTPGA